jgi:hypothetical protein
MRIKLFARWPKPFVRNGYVFRNILQTVPDSWIGKSRLNMLAINTGRAGYPDIKESGGIIVFPANADVWPNFWPRVDEWCASGVGEARHRVTLGRYLRGNTYNVGRELFDQKSFALEIEDVDEEELFEITSMIARELDQDEVLAKSRNSGHIYVLQKEIAASIDWD